MSLYIESYCLLYAEGTIARMDPDNVAIHHTSWQPPLEAELAMATPTPSVPPVGRMAREG